jgi:hypothetical protein
MTRIVTARTLAVLAAALLWCALPAMADTVVIPNVNETDPGPSNQAFPYNAGSPMRVQQVFAMDQFQGLTGAISQIAFRVDESAGDPFGPSMPIDTEVRLCHTTAQPTALSLTFDDNYGSDVTLVYDGPLVLSSAGGGAFDIVIDVDPVFTYDGTQNLLVEYKVFNGPATTQFDAAGTGLGEGGTVWVDRLWAFDPNAVTGSSNGDDGYVTQFTFGPPTPVEASTWGAIKSIFRPGAATE